MAEETKKQRYQRKLEDMRTERNSFVPHWQELTDYLSPRQSKFITSSNASSSSDPKQKGQKANSNIIDNTATLSLRTFKSGMMAGASSPARPWFNLITFDPELNEIASVKEWLYTLNARMRELFAKSNTYSILPLMYGSLGSYGTGAMAVLEDEKDDIRAYFFPVGSFFASLNDRLEVDTLYREFKMTVRQIVMQFGLDNCSTETQALWKNNQGNTYLDIVHVIEPNLDRETGKLDAKNKPFTSCYFEKASSDPNKFLSESGFDEFPCMVPRWDASGEDVYGYSPGMDTLGDIKQLQLEQKRKIEAIDKTVRPPMLGDSNLRTSGSNLVPGGITWVDNLAANQHAGMRPAYLVNPDLSGLHLSIQECQQRIKRAFYEDLMLMFATSDNPEMTAREVDERHQEKLLVLGPFLERMNDELYDPLINRTFSIMLRRGLVPPPPPELQGKGLKVEYISMMAQAQKLIGTASLERVAGMVGNLAAMNPEVLDKLDMDQAVDEYAQMHGVPPKTIRSDEQVQVIRSNRARQQQMQQMAAMAQPAAQAAQAAKSLSETNVEDVNGLTRLMGAA